MKLQVVALSRHFGDLRAVDGISFGFDAGEIYGFVGPNGAGKTTTMRILATLDEPTSGDALLDGVSIVQQPELARRRIGFVPDDLLSPRDLSVHDFLDFFARAYGLRSQQRRQVVAEVEEFTQLTGIRQKMVGALSKGMKQRVSVARALIHDPAVLIMDEPASGLDPRARVELRELLRVLAEQGKAILISSHILTELSELCTGAVILERGRIIRAGRIRELMVGDVAHRDVFLRVLDDVAAAHRLLLETPGVEEVRPANGELMVRVSGGDPECAELLRLLVSRGLRVAELRHQRADLESLFLNVTRGDVQ